MKIYYISEIKDNDICVLRTATNTEEIEVKAEDLVNINAIIVGYNKITGSIKVSDREDVYKYINSKQRLAGSSFAIADGELYISKGVAIEHDDYVELLVTDKYIIEENLDMYDIDTIIDCVTVNWFEVIRDKGFKDCIKIKRNLRKPIDMTIDFRKYKRFKGYNAEDINYFREINYADNTLFENAELVDAFIPSPFNPIDSEKAQYGLNLRIEDLSNLVFNKNLHINGKTIMNEWKAILKFSNVLSMPDVVRNNYVLCTREETLQLLEHYKGVEKGKWGIVADKLYYSDIVNNYSLICEENSYTVKIAHIDTLVLDTDPVNLQGKLHKLSVGSIELAPEYKTGFTAETINKLVSVIDYMSVQDIEYKSMLKLPDKLNRMVSNTTYASTVALGNKMNGKGTVEIAEKLKVYITLAEKVLKEIKENNSEYAYLNKLQLLADSMYYKGYVICSEERGLEAKAVALGLNTNRIGVIRKG